MEYNKYQKDSYYEIKKDRKRRKFNINRINEIKRYNQEKKERLEIATKLQNKEKEDNLKRIEWRRTHPK